MADRSPVKIESPILESSQGTNDCRTLRPVIWLPASLDACALYRMFIPHLHMENSVFSYVPGAMPVDRFSHCEVAVVQRLCTQQNFEALQLLQDRMGMKVIYDLDDNMWSIPSYNPAAMIFKKLLPGFDVCAKKCDMITVSTQNLKLMVRDELGKGCPPIEVAENMMDFDWFHPVSEKFRRKKNGMVTVGWAGTNTHSGDVSKVFALLPWLLNKLPQMEFELVGLPTPDALKGHPRVREREFVPVAEFAAHWSSWQWDLSLAPLEENAFNRSKSNIKLLEAAAMGIPCVVSAVAQYKSFCERSDVLREYVMCRSTTDWKKKIIDLVENDGLRTYVGAEMKSVAMEGFDAKVHTRRWKDLVTNI